MGVDRVGPNELKLTVGGESVEVLTEDLAALVRAELPADRGNELFSEILEQEISSGKARVIVKAEKDIKQGEEVCFTIDVNRYMNNGVAGGLRATPSGILF